ncbi:nickel ABC transporter permease [Scatolibacter rhodanostii]|uniref:nickel ABC transporter permease n=1 Tax=Scatolibacter rhodanostii TaxID=2014781 RepID=UPI000C088D72|nr:nickel ABC transporter permease [Scatolibacter rhodanostii]
MAKYILKRLLSMVVVFFGVSVLIFTLLYFTPGDPARMILGDEATEEQILKLQDELGLNDSYIEQYGRFIGNALKGDLGVSYVTGRPVTQDILSRFPTTIKLALLSTLVAVIIAIPLGVLSAIYQNKLIDNLSRIIGLFGVSMPQFWQAILLIILFSLQLRWLPASGSYGWQYWILPSFTIGIHMASTILRITRASMLDTLKNDYIMTARAKGTKEFWVITRHALKNALIPIVTVLGLRFGNALSGSVIAESIFALPGLGKLIVDAIKARDYPVVQASVFLISISYCVINLAVDILYTYINPQIKEQLRRK